MKTRQIRIRKPRGLFLSLLIGVVVSVPGTANATNGAHFTSLTADYVELDLDPEDYQGTEDDDGHADDLVVSFTETGTGNSKVMDITVTVVREITMTCVSAFGGDVVLATEEPISLRFPDESSEASATFVTDDQGQLTGTVPIHTSLGGYWSEETEEEASEWQPGDVFPRQNNATGVYLLKDYSITYTDLTVTDNENGGASATVHRVESIPGEPGYSSDDVTVAVGAGELFGVSCTIESATAGHCF